MQPSSCLGVGASPSKHTACAEHITSPRLINPRLLKPPTPPRVQGGEGRLVGTKRARDDAAATCGDADNGAVPGVTVVVTVRAPKTTQKRQRSTGNTGSTGSTGGTTAVPAPQQAVGVAAAGAGVAAALDRIQLCRPASSANTDNGTAGTAGTARARRAVDNLHAASWCGGNDAPVEMSLPDHDEALAQCRQALRAASSTEVTLRRLDSSLSPLTSCGWSDAGSKGPRDGATFFLGPALLFDALGTSATLDWGWSRPDARCLLGATRAALSVRAAPGQRAITSAQLRSSALWELLMSTSLTSIFTVVVRVATVGSQTVPHTVSATDAQTVLVITQAAPGEHVWCVETGFAGTRWAGEAFCVGVTVDVWRHVHGAAVAAAAGGGTTAGPLGTHGPLHVVPDDAASVGGPLDLMSHSVLGDDVADRAAATAALDEALEPLFVDDSLSSLAGAGVGSAHSGSVPDARLLDSLLGDEDAHDLEMWHISDAFSLGDRSVAGGVAAAGTGQGSSSHGEPAAQQRELGWWLSHQQQHLLQMVFNWQQLHLAPAMFVEGLPALEHAWGRARHFFQLLATAPKQCCPSSEATLHFFSVPPKALAYVCAPLLVAPVGADRQLVAVASLPDVAPQPVWCQLHFLKPLTGALAMEVARALQNSGTVAALASTTTSAPLMSVDWWRTSKGSWDATRTLVDIQLELLLRTFCAIHDHMDNILKRGTSVAASKTKQALVDHAQAVASGVGTAWNRAKQANLPRDTRSNTLWLQTVAPGGRSDHDVMAPMVWSVLRTVMEVGLPAMINALSLSAEHVLRFVSLPAAINPLLLGFHCGVTVRLAAQAPSRASRILTKRRVVEQVLCIQFMVRVIVWVVQRALARLLGPTAALWSDAMAYVTLVHDDNMRDHGMEPLAMDVRAHPTRSGEVSLHVTVFVPALLRCGNWFDMSSNVHLEALQQQHRTTVVGSPSMFILVTNHPNLLAAMVRRLARRMLAHVVHQFVHLMHRRGGGGRHHLHLPLLDEAMGGLDFAVALTVVSVQLQQRNLAPKHWGPHCKVNRLAKGERAPQCNLATSAPAVALFHMLPFILEDESAGNTWRRDRLSRDALHSHIVALEMKRTRTAAARIDKDGVMSI